MIKPKLFRCHPPKELVDRILQCCGFQGMHDLRWFSKEEIRVEVDEWLPEIEPYYLPCKARRFLHGEIDAAKLITILRHFLRIYEYDLIAHERLYKGAKQTMYQIQNTVFDLSGMSLTVEFD